MIIALTGGIGSGKSYVCKLLAERGIFVYDCDAHAKELMRSSQPLQKQLSALVGDDVFHDGVLLPIFFRVKRTFRLSMQLYILL